jgi:type II secretory pathway component GspD/PulD (secretin)
VIVVAVLIGGVTGVASAQRGAGGGGGGGRGGGGGAPPTTPVNASFDTRTNTLIVTGNPDQIEQIKEIISQIDNNPTKDNQVYIYKVKNGSALNMEAVANLVFTGTGGNLRGTTTSQQLSTNRQSLGAGRVIGMKVCVDHIPDVQS